MAIMLYFCGNITLVETQKKSHDPEPVLLTYRSNIDCIIILNNIPHTSNALIRVSQMGRQRGSRIAPTVSSEIYCYVDVK